MNTEQALKTYSSSAYYKRAEDAEMSSALPGIQSPQSMGKMEQPLDKDKVDNSVKKMMDSVKNDVKVEPGQELDYFTQLQEAIKNNLLDMSKDIQEKSKNLLNQS